MLRRGLGLSVTCPYPCTYKLRCHTHAHEHTPVSSWRLCTSATRHTRRLDSLLNRTNQAGVSDPATWGTYSAALQAKLQSNAAFLKDVNTPGTKSNTRPVQHLDAVSARVVVPVVEGCSGTPPPPTVL